MSYDLCDVHADTLVVPRGWRLEDRRSADVGRVGHGIATTAFERALAI